MEFTKNNKIGYMIVATSLLIILSIFLPYIKVVGAKSSFSAIFNISRNIIGPEKKIGVFFIIFILIQQINIFVQSKKRIDILTFIAALSGIIPMIMYNSAINDIEKEREIKIEYQYGFYLIVTMLCIQVLTPILSLMNQLSIVTVTNSDTAIEGESTSGQNQEENKFKTGTTIKEPTNTEFPTEKNQNVQSQDSELEALKAEAETLRAQQAMLKEAEEMKLQYEKEKQEKEQLEEEYRMLKEKAEQVKKEQQEKERIERERIERARLEREKIEKIRLEKERIEKEKLEKERQEKEKLMNEIAKLKELLNNN